jgi:hypothetical protein
MFSLPVTWVVALVLLLGQGGNQLLDYVDTREYWKLQNRPITPAEMLAALEVRPVDLDPMLRKLASPDPAVRAAGVAEIRAVGAAALPRLEEVAGLGIAPLSPTAAALAQEIRQKSKAQAVRRLMAIRTLGELRDRSALPVLEPLRQSTAMFEAQYAARAIAAITGQELPPVDDRARRRAEALLMPEDCRALVQLATPPGKATLAEVCERLGPLPGIPRTEAVARLSAQLVAVAEKVGDVRIDGVTIGVAGDVGPDDGWAAAIIHGQWDRAAVHHYVRSQASGIEVVTTAGTELLALEETLFVGLVTDERAVVCLGPERNRLPLDELIRAAQTGQGPLGEVPNMADLIARMDVAGVLWGVMRTTAAFREADMLRPFDTIMLHSTARGAVLEVVLEAQGTSPPGAAAAVQEVQDFVKQNLADIRAMGLQAMFTPGPAQFRNLLETVKCQADGGNARLEFSLDRQAFVPLLSLVFRPGGEEAEPVPPDRPQPGLERPRPGGL